MGRSSAPLETGALDLAHEAVLFEFAP